MSESTLHRLFALRALAALFACLGVSSVARADDECLRTLAPNAVTSATQIVWPAPLNRTISLKLGALPLRSALDRVAQVAKLRLSYSREMIPLERSVCLAYNGVPVGDVLTQLLEGTGIEAIALGNEQVVLAPQRHAEASRASEVSHDLAVTTPAVLSPVVVRDGGTASRTLPAGTASVSLGAEQLLSSNITTMSQLMNGSIPGMWMWESSANGTMSQYGSLRGASSFGVGTPKVYIDGIEMANPLMLNQLDPASIDKLEVIRGPQGSALFGTDAIDGVIRITTRQDGANGSAGRVSLRSETGMTQSGFAPGGVLSQDHSLNVRAGNAFRSASLGLGLSTLGDFVPGSASRRFALNSSGRILGSHGSLSASARLSAERVGNTTSPLLAGLESSAPPLLSHRAGFSTHGASLSQGDEDDGMYASTTNTAPQAMNEYTLGVNGTLTTGERWTHSLVLGVDGYHLRNVAYDLSPMPTAADSALQAARGESNRLTMRATSSASFGNDNASARATFVGDVSMLHRDVELRNGWGSNQSLTSVALPWRRNSGLTTQFDATLWRAISLTGGVRVEHDDDQITSPRTSLLPMIGATMAKSAGEFTLKVRGAWGKAIRQPQLSLMGGGSRGVQLLQSATNLKPEQQVGFEGGADFEFGNAFQFHVTRFDQHASNLIQAVATAPSSGGGAPRVESGGFSEPNYTLQNVGEIANHGWELQASTAYRTLRVDGSLSLVDSRVTAVSAGYRGDLRAGDRMLQVPARVGSLTTTWNPRGWSLSLGASRAWNWVNYDRLSLAQASAAGWSAQNGHRPEGSELRTYWMNYDGATRLRATVTRDLFRNLSLRLSGENLLGIQRGEPDNVTIVPGRTIRAGFTTRF